MEKIKELVDNKMYEKAIKELLLKRKNNFEEPNINLWIGECYYLKWIAEGKKD